MENDEEIQGFGFRPIGKVKARRLAWWIDDILQKDTLVFISASPKAGKSTCALYTALKITCKMPFLGRYKTRRTKVLYFCLEDHLGETKARAKHFLQGRRFPRNLLISNADVLSLPMDFAKLKADIVNSEAGVVVIDTLRRAHVEDENSSSKMALLLNELRRLVRTLGVTIVVIHHAGHDLSKVSEAERDRPEIWLRGTSDLFANWETLITLKRGDDDRVTVRVFHKYRSDLEKMFYKVQRGSEIDKATGDYPIVDLVLDNSDFEKQQAEDAEAVYKTLKEDSDSANGLERKLKGKISRPRIDAALRRLEVKKWARHEGKSKNARWFAVIKDSSTDQDGRKDPSV